MSASASSGKTLLSRWLAVELAAGLAGLCVTIVGVSLVVSLLITGNVATLLPVSIGSGSTAAWLGTQSWPLVAEAWSGFPAAA